MVIFVNSGIGKGAPSLFKCSILQISANDVRPRLVVNSIVLKGDISSPATLGINSVVACHNDKRARKLLIARGIMITPCGATSNACGLRAGNVTGSTPSPRVSARSILCVVIYGLKFVSALCGLFLSP